MTSSSDLFELIHSLSGAEKSYFKKFSALHIKGDSNNYVKLFDAIAKQKKYNESEIKKQFASESFIKRLPAEKIYLQNLILKSLRLFHSQRSPDFVLRKKIEYAYIYIDKGLYKQAEKLLSKIKASAKKHELFLALAEIINAENKLLGLIGDSSQKTTNEKNSDLFTQSLNSEKIIHQIQHKEKELIHLYVGTKGNARDNTTIEKVKKIINDPIFNENQENLPLRGKMLLHNAKAGFYYFTSEYEKAYYHNKKYYEAAYAQYELLNEENNYIISLYNLFTICFLQKKWDECNEILNSLKKLPFANNPKNQGMFARMLSMEMSLCVAEGDFKKGLPIASKSSQFLQNNREKINKGSYYNILYFSAYIYFGAEKYSESLRCLNVLLNSAEARKIEYIYSAAYILAIINHIEIAKNNSFEFILKPFYKYLYQKNRLFKFETELLLFIKKDIANVSSKTQLINVYKNLLNKLTPLKNDTGEQESMKYFDIISWLESKIDGESFGDIIRKKKELKHTT